MAKPLTDDDINLAIDIIESWDYRRKYSWPAIAKAFEEKTGRSVSVPSLCDKNRPIYDVYVAVRESLKSPTIRRASKSKNLPSLKIAAKRIENKDKKIERLEKENAQLLEQFHIWLYNAHLHGVSVDKLNMPLPNRNEK
jgi:hypothetical protein